MRDDIQAAADAIKLKFGYKPEMKALDRLTPNERVTHLVFGRLDKHAGLIALTSQRVIFVHVLPGAMLNSETVVSTPRDQITAVETELHGLTGALTITSASSVNTFTKVPRQYLDGFAAALRTPTAQPGDSADQLLKLQQLRQAGILSEDEFQSKAKPIIASL